MANVHTTPQKEFIVRAIASFCTPRDIVTAFMARWRDTKCTEADVDTLDPRFVVLDPELHAIFRTERQAVLTDPDAAPYADQKARLIALSHDVAFYRANNQPAEARAVMRQIAEELGVVGGKGASKDKTEPGATDTRPVTAIEILVVDPKPIAEPVE